ncbi:hypothetical protein SJAG_06269 [Schizosaccharomyces japonicus yFS275]|uniref:Uncharacterized protein n=1 Tax=Schizosaccharomyces japonicus (strain yFS275 / FY16936) TaxID=402676 RepID=T0RSW7_SCHJY|nr:hypothetical protein SJAG_06269 [Schizosaccharomyces japonicus yFS275]EQC53040.1 hypothetical protein SJAG_06269 [Schizosaccharomyces japonicus yFS275]
MFSSLYVPKEPIGKYMPFLALFQLYVIFGEPYLGLTYFQWIRDLLGPKIMILTVQILVYAHSIEAYIALMYSTSRKLPFSITFVGFYQH